MAEVIPFLIILLAQLQIQPEDRPLTFYRLLKNKQDLRNVVTAQSSQISI